MKLFIWNSSTIDSRDSDGTIVVMAESVDDARKKVIESARSYYLNDHPFGWLDQNDTEESEEYIEFLNNLKLDLMKEPFVKESVAFL